jgi:hypothetical protein
MVRVEAGVRLIASVLLGVGLLGAASALSGTAQAAMAPDNVAEELQIAAKECRESGGRPNTDAMLKALDFTGKGGPDWIVDFAKLRCEGALNPFCGSGGCGLELFTFTGGSDWQKVFDENVLSYRIVNVNKRPALHFVTGGAACGRVNAKSCTYIYQSGKTRQMQ